MVRINLLPVRVSKKKEAGKQQLVLLVVLLLGGIVLNGWYNVSRYGEMEQAERDVKRTRAKVAELDKIIGEVNQITAQQEELKRKLGVLAELRQGRTGPVRMLDELATITPKRLWLREMTEKGGSIVFAGSAATIDDVSGFIRAMKGSKYFADVELKRTDAKPTGPLKTVEFTMTATARYTANTEADAKASKPAGAKAGG